jgi:hypothetical protein
VTRTDSLVPSQNVSDGQYAWTLGFAPCTTASVAPVRIASWNDRPNGLLQLGDSVAIGSQGGPIIDRAGSVVALGTSGRTAVPGLHASEVLALARRSATANQLTTLAEMGRRENHLFGSLLIRSTTAGASARVTPQETWQWPELRRQGTVPLTFAGPAGRYQVELLVGGQVRQTLNASITPGSQTPVSLEAQVAQVPAGGTPAGQPAVRRKGKSPLPFILLGVAGAGAAVVVLMPKGDDTGGGGGNGGGTGSITISVPVNP